jgi:hypothetical protein
MQQTIFPILPLGDKQPLLRFVDTVTVIKLDDAPKGYVDFDKGTAKISCLIPTCCWQRE